MGKVFKAIALSASFSLFLNILGCSSTTQQASTAQLAANPSITRVLPQTITAGSPSTTLQVTGTNFPTQAAILWNGAAVATTVVDSNTLSGKIDSSSIATPGTVQLQVENTQTMQASQAVPIVIAPAGTNTPSPLTISTNPLPQGVVGTAYNGTLGVSGGTSPYVWSVTTGQLPAGLTLAASTGVISGTPSNSGNFSFGVTVVDSGSSQQSASSTVSLSVGAAPATVTALVVNTSSLPSGTVGTAYSTVLQANGGASPYTWSVSGGLPAGLALAPSTGIISGTPTAAGTANLTATVADAGSPAQTKSVTLSLVVAPSTLAITSSTLPSGTQSSNYSTALQASGGSGSYTWSIGSGSLPAGLSLAASTGIISGKPTGNGNFSFGVTVKDGGSPAQTASATVTLTVVQAGAALAISTTALPGGLPNQAYNSTLNATGGTSPYTWSLTSGTLPSGLGLAASTGIISGTPTASSTSSLSFKVVDSSSPAQSKSVTLSLVIAPATLSITTSSLSGGTNGTSYSNLLQAAGGTTPYTWSISSGSLPAGLTLAPATGLISGTPTATGTSSFTVLLKDGGSPAAQSQSVKLSIAIAAAPPSTLTVSTTSLGSGTKGTSYSSSLQAGGGTTPYTWSISSGSLPAGVALSASTGLISGTPTATGTSAFTATVTDAGSPAQTQSVKLSIAVAAAAPTTLTVGTTLVSGTVGTTYSSSITATGGTPGYTWSFVSGNIPAGLSMNTSTGLISGTPTASGTATFNVAVTDSGSPAQSQTVKLSIVVAAATSALSINATLPSGTVGTAYSNPMSASGGTPAYTWSISAGSLPPGLTLAATTGIISGTPSTNGTYSFTATVSDNGSPVQTQSAGTSIVVGSAQTTTGPGTTWFVRPDGGSRYSGNQTQGQCDGLADVGYGGTGTNQHCAFNDVRYMWMDGSYGNSAWIMAGGDTLVIRGCTALGTQGNPDNPHCRIGSDNATNSNIFCQGVSQYWGCAMPPPPNGTAGQHTRILGGCAYGTYSCTPIGTATTANGYPWTGNNLTQLFSGFNAGGLMYLYGASYIDVEGLELTTHNGACTTMGSPAYPKACSTSSPVDDFGRWGIVFTNTTTNILLQDVYIHGFTNIGIGGPFGAGITLTRVFSGFNAFAGWNMDDGSSTPDGTGASLIQSYVTMIGNGCLEQYPIANAQFPAMACWDSNDGGFGDAWSGQNTNLDTFTCDHCNISYNGKDAALGPHTLVKNLTYTNSITVGNMGQQGKWGMQKNSTAVFENDLLVGNCYRMSQQLPGAVQNFALSTGLPGSYLSNYCRASGDTFSFFSDTGSTVTISNNTFISYQPTVFDFGFGTAGQGAGVPYVLKNNIFFGYNTGYTFSPFSNSQPGLYYLGEGSVVVSASNDIEFGVRNGDPCSGTILCVDPLLVNEPAQVGAIPPESALDNFNFHPTSGSPAIGAGTSYSGMLPTDYYGNARPTSPAIGAVQP